MHVTIKRLQPQLNLQKGRIRREGMHLSVARTENIRHQHIQCRQVVGTRRRIDIYIYIYIYSIDKILQAKTRRRRLRHLFSVRTGWQRMAFVSAVICGPPITEKRPEETDAAKPEQHAVASSHM